MRHRHRPHPAAKSQFACELPAPSQPFQSGKIVILLNTKEAGALLAMFEGKPLVGDAIDHLNRVAIRLANHRHLIATCEAAIPKPAHMAPKEPA